MFAVNNFLADLAALLAVHIFLKKQVRARRIFFGALFGTLGSCAVFAVCRNLAACLLFVHFILNPLLLFYCFREKRRDEFLRDLCAGYFAFLIIGGITEWMYAGGTGFFTYELSVCAAVILLLASVIWARCRRRKDARFFKAEICQGEKRIFAQALSDTGNLLNDPYTGRQVSMVDRRMYEEAFGPPQAVRMIPYESLGCKHGLLEAVTIEELSYVHEGCRKAIPQAVLGLAEHALFENKPYQMIINPQENPAGGKNEKDR